MSPQPPLRHVAARLTALLVLPFLGIASGASADTEIGVFVSDTLITAGEEAPQVSVSGFNTDPPVTVDVHLGLIAPNGTIYEYPNWNTSLQPWLSNFTLPEGFTFPPTPVFQAGAVPGGLTPGIWQAAAALTVPGTLQIVDLTLTPFNVATDAAAGSVFGALSLSRQQTFDGAEVDAGGLFAQSTTDLDELVQGIEGEQPGLEQCLFNEIALDFGFIGIGIQTLDAGTALSVSSAATGALALPQDPDAASLGFFVYAAQEPVDSSNYQGGAGYRFQGTGGAQIGPFTTPEVVAPPPLDLTQPPLSATASHPAATDLELAWSGNNGVGEVEVELSGTKIVSFDSSTLYQIRCRFSDDGQALVPSSLLTQLKNSLAGGILPFPTTPVLSVSRQAYALFDIAGGYGVASIDSGASMPLVLQ
jgi:hypothetical protein